MSTPLAPVAPAGPIQGRLSPPPNSANQTQSAVYKLGEVLKELVHAIPSAFQSENQVHAALSTIDGFVKAHVPDSARRALSDIPARAAVEDVSKRNPPAGVSYAIPQSMSINYDALAEAMIRAQQRIAAEQPPPAPAIEQESVSNDYPEPVA